MIGDIKIRLETAWIEFNVPLGRNPYQVPLHVTLKLGQIDGVIDITAAIVKVGVRVFLLASVPQVD